MAGPRRKIRAAVLLVVLLVLFYMFVSTSTPKEVHKTELSSDKLKSAREAEMHSNWQKIGQELLKQGRLPQFSTLREQLSFQFPYDPSKGFEKNIWQTWKVGLDHPDFSPRYRLIQESWTQLNPTYNHYIVSDEECDVMVQQMFLSVPDVARAWKLMPKSILKADFFRYLILFTRGGVYSDIDTRCLQPVDDWMSNSDKIFGTSNDAGLVVGIEADPDREDWAEWYARRIQFCQWTIQAKKGHPMLRELIAKITELTLQRERNGQLDKVLGKDAGGDIMNWTGPGIWTDMLFAYMNNVAQPEDNFRRREYDEIVTWKLFTGLDKPMLLNDVLVLPITSFSPDVGQMGAQSSSHPLAYAKHLFLGSWKDDKPRKKDKH